MKILAARKILDGDMYIPLKGMATPETVAKLQEAVDAQTAKVWTSSPERKLLLASPCNAQMWAPEMGSYDIQIEEL